MHRISTSLSLSLTLSVCLSSIVARRKEQLELSQSPHIKKGRLLCLRIPIIIFLNEKNAYNDTAWLADVFLSVECQL